MVDDVLLRFLKNGLINVDGDDEKLKKIQTTADDLAGVLLKVPSKSLAFALVAFDPEVSESEPVVVEVLQALAHRWPTYVNTIAGSPITVVRGILLASLESASKRDVKVAAAFVAGARNVLPFTPVGPERPIWQDLVSELEDLVETQAEIEWATPDTIELAKPELTLEPVAIPKKIWKVDREKLRGGMLAAAGPHGEDGHAGADNPNPYWPGNNQAWVTKFGERATTAIADALDPALRVEVGPLDLSSVFGPLVETLASQLKEALDAVASSSKGLQRRTALLWWREALYSPSERVSYRSMELSEAAALMAYDLHQQCPLLSPLSVTAFLDEAVAQLGGELADEHHTFTSVVEVLRGAPLVERLRSAVESMPMPEGRGPVLSVLVKSQAVEGEAFRRAVGVPADTKVTPRSLAVWLFRELQACRISAPEPPRRKGRKSA